MSDALQSISAYRMSNSKATVPYSTAALNQDLLRVRAAWRKFQSSRQRDAVYLYLAAVFELVVWWQEERQAHVYAGLALDVLGNEELIEAGLLFAGTPDQVKSQIDKFSRAMGGFGNLLLMFQGGDLGHADTSDSLTLFGREVLPQIQEGLAGLDTGSPAYA